MNDGINMDTLIHAAIRAGDGGRGFGDGAKKRLAKALGVKKLTEEQAAAFDAVAIPMQRDADALLLKQLKAHEVTCTHRAHVAFVSYTPKGKAANAEAIAEVKAAAAAARAARKAQKS